VTGAGTKTTGVVRCDQPEITCDLEKRGERAKRSNPTLYLAVHENELVILDEVHLP
jgi:hypothetical protein